MLQIALGITVVLFIISLIGWIISFHKKNYDLSFWFNLGVCGTALLINILSLIQKLMA